MSATLTSSARKNVALSDRIRRGVQEYGECFDPSEMLACPLSTQYAFSTGAHVRVRTMYADGDTFERTGVVSSTGGHRPALLLMHRRNATGSWDVLGPRDHIVATWDGRQYS